MSSRHFDKAPQWNISNHKLRAKQLMKCVQRLSPQIVYMENWHRSSGYRLEHGSAKVFYKGKTLNIKGHTISVITTQLYSYSMKIAIDNT